MDFYFQISLILKNVKFVQSLKKEFLQLKISEHDGNSEEVMSTSLNVLRSVKFSHDNLSRWRNFWVINFLDVSTFFRRLEKAKEEEKVQVKSSPFIVRGRRTTESPDDYYTFKTLSRFSFHVSLPYAIQALSVVLSCCISSLRKFVSFNLTCVYPFPINTHRARHFRLSFLLFSFFIARRLFLSTPFSWCVELNFNSSSKCSPSGLRQVYAVVLVDCKEISTFKKLEGRKGHTTWSINRLYLYA